MADEQLLSQQHNGPNGCIVATVTGTNNQYNNNEIDKLKNCSNGNVNGSNSINLKNGIANKTIHKFTTNEIVASNDPPDGGTRAWCVMIAAFLCNSIIFGIINTYGTGPYKTIEQYLKDIHDAEPASKACLLNGPDIRKLMADELFDSLLGGHEKIAWDCVKAVIENCLGGHRSENFRILIDEMMTAFENLQVNMSLKIHFLHSHLDVFARQSPTESEEHGVRFHQVAAPLEFWYSGKKLDALLADLCWNLIKEEY